MSVPRFDSDHSLALFDDGAYVRYEDYATLEAGDAALKAKLAKADGLAEALEKITSRSSSERWAMNECWRVWDIASKALAAYKEDKR